MNERRLPADIDMAAETCDSTQGLDTGANAAGMGALVE